MNKLIETVLSRLPQEVCDIIHEYARDDKHKKEFLKTYERLFFVWVSILPYQSQCHKMVSLMSYSTCETLSVKVWHGKKSSKKDSLLVHFGNVHVQTSYDNSFYLRSGIPECYIWNVRFLQSFDTLPSLVFFSSF